MTCWNIRYGSGWYLNRAVLTRPSGFLLRGGWRLFSRRKKGQTEKIPGIGDKLADYVYKNDVLKKAEAEIDFVKTEQGCGIIYLDEHYPERLRHCEDARCYFRKSKTNFNRHKCWVLLAPAINWLWQGIVQAAGWKSCGPSSRPAVVADLPWHWYLRHKSALKNQLETQLF